MEIPTEIFLRYLKETLENKLEKNPSYSLRAFASSLNVEASSLSQILRQKRPLTQKMKRRLLKGLDLDEKKISTLGLSGGKQDLDEGQRVQISLDNFRLLSRWHHFAILELTHTIDFVADPKWISKRLGVSQVEVQLAIERLVRMGYLEIKNGKYIDQIAKAEVYADEYSSSAQKKLQKSILEMAAKAIDEVSYEKRVQSSMSLAVSKKRIPYLKSKVRKFLADLEKELEQDEERDEVYHLTTAIYPVTK